MLAQLIDLYTLIVFGAVIISWAQLPPTRTVAIVLHTLTEPVLNPVRRVLPPMDGPRLLALRAAGRPQFVRRLL